MRSRAWSPALTPRLPEPPGRLGTRLPFRPAARMPAVCTGVPASEATARRQTGGAGAAYVALPDAEAARLAWEPPEPPAVHLATGDGAMGPLRRGEWGEVKTLPIGTADAGPDGPRARESSYFSRRADHAAVARLAPGETQTRGTETAGIVVGVCDGAALGQRVLGLHRPGAVRVRGFPHAAGYLAAAATARSGAETAAARAWPVDQAHERNHGDPVLVSGAIEGGPAAAPRDPAAAVAAQARAAASLGTRPARIRCARFRAAGDPIGSGAGERGNKGAVEGRPPGAGMPWAPEPGDPMGAWRTSGSSDPRAVVRPRIGAALRASARRAPRPAPVPPAPPRPPAPAPRADPAAYPKTIVNGRPAKGHPRKATPWLPGGRAHRAPRPVL